MQRFLLIFLLLGSWLVPPPAHAAAAGEEPPFLRRTHGFPAEEEAIGLHDPWSKVAYRARSEPFLPVATAIFAAAILHTFLAGRFIRAAHRAEEKHRAEGAKGTSFKATILHFAGEVEAIFGIWAAILLGALAIFHGPKAAADYVSGVNFTEPLFVVVIMAMAGSRPVLKFTERCLRLLARLGKETPAAWWWAILTAGPLLGSFITEPGAMTLCAALLGRRFYHLKPRPAFAYATLGLLFVNISMGGLLTHFAAPPVLMVATKWGLTTPEMLLHYGSKAVASILASTACCHFIFRKDLRHMAGNAPAGSSLGERIPWWVTAIHLAFMAWTVACAHIPPLFIGGFLFFLAFSQATAHHQREMRLGGPVLVGFFLAGLVVHGGLQGWWLEPILASLGKWPLFLGSMGLTSFNDNAAITFLASQVGGLGPQLKYAVLAGAVAGGGLTVIANAPNPAGQTLLSKYFEGGVSPLKLLAGALLPTLIAGAALMLFPDWGVEKMFQSDDPSPAPAIAAGSHHSP